MRKCDICHEEKDTVRVLHHKATPVMLACTDCISKGETYKIHEMVYSDGSEWYVEDTETGDIVSGMFPTKAEAHSFIDRKQEASE